MTKVAQFFNGFMAGHSRHRPYTAVSVLSSRHPSGDNLSTEELKVKLDNAYKFRI